MTLRLRTLLGDYPCTAALKAGSIASDSIAFDFVDYSPTNKGFKPMVREQAFDVSEQDLNGDGTTGVLSAVIQTDTNSFGSTILVTSANNYYFENASTGLGSLLYYQGTPVTAGEFVVGGSTWTPIGVALTSTGYEVAWKLGSTDEYSVWATDSSGNYTSNLYLPGPGSSTVLASLESSFDQDLNQDGYIGSPSTVIEASGNIVIGVTPFAQAATIDSAATLELTGAASGSVTFNAATGTLVLDHSSAFSGQVFGLSGNGNVATSDVLDLRDISSVGAMESYNGNTTSGILTVSDNQGHVAHISLMGNYTSSTFTLSSDGKGGTLVVDPPIAQPSAGTPTASNTGAKADPIVGSSLPSGGTGAFNVITYGAGSDFSMDTHPITSNVTQASPPIAADRAMGSFEATTGRSASSAGDKNGADRLPGASAIALVAGEQPPKAAAISSSAVAREVVSPNEVIRAINGGNIALKFSNDQDRRIWLFDEAEGDFVPPASQPLTIVIDHEGPAPASSLQSVEEAAGLLATAAMISNQPTWLGTLRQIRRRAAGALGMKWME